MKNINFYCVIQFEEYCLNRKKKILDLAKLDNYPLYGMYKNNRSEETHKNKRYNDKKVII